MKKTKKNVTKKKRINKKRTFNNKRNKYLKRRKLNEYKKGGRNLKISSILKIISILNKYSTIYIAIGGKYVKDNYPISLNTGVYQLVPQFILNELAKDEHIKTLIIIIDSFNKEEYKINNDLIKENLKNMDKHSNIDYIFIDNLFNKTLCDELKLLINNLNLHQNIYIADYVYYFSPNTFEHNNRIKQDELLKELLNLLIIKFGFLSEKDMPLNKNIYKWLGGVEPNYISKFYIYDIIYNSWVGAINKNNKKQIFFNINNSLRITPDFE